MKITGFYISKRVYYYAFNLIICSNSVGDSKIEVGDVTLGWSREGVNRAWAAKLKYNSGESKLNWAVGYSRQVHPNVEIKGRVNYNEYIKSELFVVGKSPNICI